MWAKFQSARTTHTTLLRDELLKTIEWKRASSQPDPPVNRIEGLLARLRWPGVFSISREQTMTVDEDDFAEVSPEKKVNKRRRKSEAIESPFRINALR